MVKYSRLARQVFATSFVPWLIASWGLFFVNGMIWASLFEHYFGEEEGVDSGVRSSLVGFAGASLSLIVGTVYSTWLGKMLRDYLAGPTKYLNLLVYIGHAGDAIAGLHRTSAEGSQLRESMVTIKATLQHLAFYTYRIFAPENRDRIGLTEDRPVLPFGLAARVSYAELAATYPVTYKVDVLPDALDELANRLHRGEMSTVDFVHALRAYLFSQVQPMLKADVDMEIIHMALNPLEPVWEQLAQIEIGALVQQPAIFDLHMQALFAFYFFLWVPVSSWAAIGWGWTVMIYPWITLAFLGIGVYNAWIGDAFDPSRPVLVADLLGAREKYAVLSLDRKFGE
jgi:hypothetical protein